MNQESFSIIFENLHPRLQDLSRQLVLLKRPVLIIMQAAEMYQLFLHNLEINVLYYNDPCKAFGIDCQNNLQNSLWLDFLPQSGQIVLFNKAWYGFNPLCPLGRLSLEYQSCLSEEAIHCFERSLVNDGILLVKIALNEKNEAPSFLDLEAFIPFKTFSSNSEYENKSWIMEQLIDSFEKALDPEMENEGEEDHEAEALARRLAQPEQSSFERHAPLIPAGTRGRPQYALGLDDENCIPELDEVLKAHTKKSPKHFFMDDFLSRLKSKISGVILCIRKQSFTPFEQDLLLKQLHSKLNELGTRPYVLEPGSEYLYPQKYYHFKEILQQAPRTGEIVILLLPWHPLRDPIPEHYSEMTYKNRQLEWLELDRVFRSKNLAFWELEKDAKSGDLLLFS